MEKRAFSYIRFSSAEQSKGDSLRRQLEAAQDYANRNGLILDDELTFRDLGISAFKGDNFSAGLGAFLAAVDKGQVPSGSYLLIENFDRFSRAKVFTAISAFIGLLAKNIHVVTLMDEQIYHQESMGYEKFMQSAGSFNLANMESEKKSKRISQSWKKKLSEVEVKALTKWVPAWLQVTDEGVVHPVPERVQLVQQMFQWSLEGLGTRLIIAEIDKLGIAPWGASPSIRLNKSKDSPSRFPTRWHTNTIGRILRNRAVLGEFRSSILNTKNSDTALTGIFPKIIDEDVFYKVNSGRTERRKNFLGTGPKSEKVTNLFSGLLKCGYSQTEAVYKCAGDNETVVVINKGPGNASKYLQCARIKDGSLGCQLCNKYWRYDNFEKLFLNHIEEIDYSVLLGSKNQFQLDVSRLETELSTTQGKLREVIKQTQKLTSSFIGRETIGKSLLDLVDDYDLQQALLEDKIKELQSRIRLLKDNIKQWDHTENDLKQLLTLISDPDSIDFYKNRLRLAEIIRQYVSKVEVFTKGELPFSQSRTLKKDASDVAFAKWMESNKQHISNFSIAMFRVYYKSGDTRTVYATNYKGAKRAGSNLKTKGKVVV